jgi:hypothetical protein
MIGSPAANRRASCIREERKSPPLKVERKSSEEVDGARRPWIRKEKRARAIENRRNRNENFCKSETVGWSVCSNNRYHGRLSATLQFPRKLTKSNALCSYLLFLLSFFSLIFM